jgi:parallel beta-helix repeat protein
MVNKSWGNLPDRIKEQLRASRSARVGLLAAFAVVFVGVIFALTKASSFFVGPEADSGTISSCANKVADTSASGGLAVKFGTCQLQATSPPLSLDPTGNTIVDTDYPVPTGAIFMATNGNDANAGTQAAPVKTIKRAIAAVPSGGTIVVRAGVYRDANNAIVNGKFTTTTKTFTLQPYPHEKAWFDGTDVVTSWTSDGAGHWYTSWDTSNFCQQYQSYPTGGYYSQVWPWQGTPSTAGPCVHADMMGNQPTSDPDPQMAFVNDAALAQVHSLASVTSTSFYNDTVNRRIYIGVDPSGKTVELTKQPNFMTFEGGAGGNIIRGLGFRKFASQEKPEGSFTFAVFFADVPNILFENNTFTQNAGASIMLSAANGTVFRANTFADNGFNGMGGYNSSNVLLEDNLVYGNNTSLLGGGCSASCGQAGVKWNKMAGYTVRNNIFENNMGNAHGFWCDIACTDGKHYDNLFVNNGGAGLFYEISSGGTIASNVFVGNKAYGIKMGSATTRIYNNTLINNNVSMLIYDDSRQPGEQGAGPDTTNVDVFNNVMANTTSAGNHMQSWRTSTAGSNTGPNTFYSGFDYNSYYRATGTGQLLHNWRDGTTTNYYTVANFTAGTGKGWDTHSQDITSGGDPFFVDLAAKDYRIRSGSVAYGSGTTIPSDIVTMLGLSSGTGQNRGALIWPGRL